ncbi:unnamed protein product [Caenorhabditis bovis]|uniref:Activin_recp domain-containing protein n=1 Tax=Caenorhabditis bovis TaxID=2654633 RepID=A0A8S1F920_9PELO|nr:unnamed protein product [Caenorhabditis bovis]
MNNFKFVLTFAVFGVAMTLECYTGYTYLAAQSVGTTKETCKHATDYCYNMTADISSLSEVKGGGCSSTRCFLARNKCIKQIVAGKQIQFCCCNTGDLCNSKLTNLGFFEKSKQRAKDLFDMLRG